MNVLDRSILKIALPSIISNVTVPLLGLIDVAIVGHIGAAAYIGAIALGSSMFSMMYWLTGFLRMSTAGLTAQSFGAADIDDCKIVLQRGLLVSFALSVLILLLSHPIALAMSAFFDADTYVSAIALKYFGIVIFGAPAVLAMYVVNGWFIGMQDTRTPMWIAITTNVANIVVSALLVFVFKLDIVGVAIGTISAQWLSIAVSMLIIIKRYKLHHIQFGVLVDASELKRLFKLNSDIFLRTLCLVAVTMWFTRAGAKQGTDILAANALLMQMFLFFSYFSDGFAYAGEALAGEAFGANNMPKLRLVEHALLKWGACIAAAFAIIYYFGGEYIVAILTDSKDVIRVTMSYIAWIALVPLSGVYAFIYDGIYVGITRTRSMLGSVALGAVFFFGVYIICADFMGNNALWLAFNIYLLVRGLLLKIMLKA